MESVEWIFTDHKLHKAMLQLLKEERDLRINDASDTTDSDDEIGGMLLVSPPLDGMPHAHTQNSSTEWAVIKLHSINRDQQTLECEIQRYHRLLRLYDAVMRTMTSEECWFVTKHYDDGYSLTALLSLPDSPFQNLSRSTMSNYKKRLLHKAAHFFVHLQILGS